MTTPDPTPIIELIEAFRRSKTMFTALTLGIFDRLHNCDASAAGLARALSADPDAMERLLDGCAALGLLRKSGGRYLNEPVADMYLWSESPRTLSGYVEYSDRALYPMWGRLADAVREGTPRWTQTFGWEGSLFDHFFHTPEARRSFLRGMHGFGMLSSPPVVDAFPLGRFRTIADLGGGTGHLTIAACQRYPGLEGVIFDLPAATEMAREQVALSTARDRIRVVDGDFFEDPLPPADLYAVGRILHDWGEEKIGRLLRNVFAGLPEGGGLLIAEKLLLEDGVGPVSANMQSLNMLVVTEGRERTLEDYRRLLLAAGFAEVEGRRTGSPLDAVLALKR